jgi:hypothetical protein
MSYPHVAALWYRLKSAPNRSFPDLPPVERHTDAFFLRLDRGVLTVWMLEHHATEESARRRVEDYLRRWEIFAALVEYGGHADIHFDFDRADVLNLDPPSPEAGGSQAFFVVRANAQILGGSSVKATPSEVRYPNPPDRFRMSADVEVVWSLYNLYREGRYPLLPMTYAFVTYLEAISGGQQRAALRYRVSRNVLSKLSNLSTNLGTGAEARKHKTRSERRPPSNQEIHWIDMALRTLVRRVGEEAYDEQFPWPQITLGDLPDLPDP